MKVVREITYESEDEERMLHQLKTSLGDGDHEFGTMKISIETIGGEKIRGSYTIGPHGRSHDKQE